MNYIQDTWNNDDDDFELVEKYPFKRVTREEIWKLRIQDVKTLFCDSDVFSRWSVYIPPPTYPTCFNNFYHRDIKQLTFEDLKKLDWPYFVKPVGNQKKFDGLVVDNKWDWAYLEERLQPKDKVWWSLKVNFLNEWRLFILENKLFGMIESTRYVFTKGSSSGKRPPNEYINSLLSHNVYKNVVIDIGLIDKGNWAVVEVNPPYSLSSYGLPIEDLYEYNRRVVASV